VTGTAMADHDAISGLLLQVARTFDTGCVFLDAGGQAANRQLPRYMVAVFLVTDG
jgi:hypothetical protein